ncbi:hypothetical protein D3C86_1137000 [compost metagenome]
MKVAAGVAFFPLANARTEGGADVELLVENGENEVLMAAAETGFGEVFLDRNAGFLRNSHVRNEEAGGGVRVGEADLLALGVCQRLDAAVLAGNHDRVITGRTVSASRGQDRVDGLRIGQSDLGVGGSAHGGDVDGAAEQTLDDTVIVRRRENLNFGNAGCSLEAIGNALGVADLVGFVFGTVETDAQNLDVLSHGGTGQNAKGDCRKKDFLQHGLSPVSRQAGVCCEVFGP